MGGAAAGPRADGRPNELVLRISAVEPLDGLLGAPMVVTFLRLAVGVARALGKRTVAALSIRTSSLPTFC